MIPILYENTETTFTSNGIGRLNDCLSCTVTEERNGVYECQFTYPVTGQHYSDIVEGRIIGVIHDDRKDIQPFDIYKRSAPLNGVVTFYAHHISYRLGNIILDPFNTHSAVQTMNAFVQYSMNPNPFSFWTDKVTTGEFEVDVPISIKAVLGGMEGSVLDVYSGGEYEWDIWAVKLYERRGQDTDVEIRYGKNLTDLKYDYDTTDVYTAVAPYWKAQGEDDDTVVVLPEGYIVASEPGYTRIRPLDLSSVWQEAPTVTQLRNEATRRLNSGRPWIPKESIKVNFVALWQTEEYANIAPLQRVRLCDTVKIIYPTMGVNATAKIIKVVYDVLSERYNSMELGDSRTSFKQALFADLQNTWLKAVPTSSMMQAAIDHATDLITGGLGGHVVINTNADGQPNEILILDTDNISTAVKVLRINQNGIGFSQNGYNGQFHTAWTLDGHFVADFITSGNMNANLITTGVITDRYGHNYWNLDTGEISISVEHGEEGEVTQADLARVQNNAKNYADSVGEDAKDYADIVRTDLTTALSVQSGQIMARVSSEYATRQEMGMAIAGNITLQIPYTYSNGVAHFRAVVYRSTENVTDEFAGGLFEWYMKSEAYVDRQPLGSGKTLDINMDRARYGMTIVCRFSLTSEPEYWTDHNGTVITDHEGTPFQFATIQAVLEAESAVYQPNYTESRLAQLSMTDEEIRAEVEHKINDDVARSLISQTADRITQEVERATTAEGHLRSSISQEAGRITAEIRRASEAEGDLSATIVVTERSLTSTITEKVTEEKNRAIGAERELSSSISQEAGRITAEINDRRNEVSALSTSLGLESGRITAEVRRATEAEEDLGTRVELTERGLSAKITSSEAQTLINASADSIRLKTGKLAWSSNNSTLTADGIFSVTALAGSGFDRKIQMSDGMINFLAVNSSRGTLEPTFWNTSETGGQYKYGITLKATASYAAMTAGSTACFIANNGLNLYGATEKAIIATATYIANKLRVGSTITSGSITSSGSITASGAITSSGAITAGGTLTVPSKITFNNDIQLHRFTASGSRIGLEVLGDSFIVGSMGIVAGYIAQFAGSIYVNGTVRQTSDERKKEVMVWDDKSDDFIMELKPIMYRWKDGMDDQIHVGIGAQTTQKLIDDLDFEVDSIVDHDEEADVYSVSYMELIPLLINTVQKQEQRIRKLEQMLEVVLNGNT